MNDRRKRLLGGIYDYISHIVTRSIRQNRKIILWGYGKSGAFLEHILRDFDGRVYVKYIVDEYLAIVDPINSKIYRSSLFQYIENSQYIVLSTVRNSVELEKILKKYGYVKGENWFDVREDIGGSYLEFLQKTVHGADFAYVTKEERPDLYGGEYYESKPFDHSSADYVFEQMYSLDANPAFFDIGCGKGQMLFMAYLSGMEHIGGIEWNSDIYFQALENMRLLDVPCRIHQGDATGFSEFDEYNIFFMYNPFGGNSVEKVVGNIQASQMRRMREIYFVYGNPFFHERVVSDGRFRLYKQLKVDLYDPLLNVYKLGGNEL